MVRVLHKSLGKSKREGRRERERERERPREVVCGCVGVKEKVWYLHTYISAYSRVDV